LKIAMSHLFPFPFLMDAADDTGSNGGGGAAPGGDSTAGGEAPGDSSAGAGQDLSLREELDAQFEISTKGPEASDLSAAAKKLAAARKTKAAPIDKMDDKVIAESGRAAAANKERAAKEAELAKLPPEERQKREAEEKRKAEEAKGAGAVEAPAHWPSQAREMFAKQPPEVKTWLLDRHKAMETDYIKKTQELAPTRRLQEELDDIFKPYEDEMRKVGTTRAAAIRELVGVHTRMRENPVEGLKYLASAYQIDLKNLANAPAADPAGESAIVNELRGQVVKLTDQVKVLGGAQSDQQQAARLQEVEQFASEKDAQGNPKRPHFDELSTDIALMIRASVDKSGRPTISLQDAYDKAVYANPTTRAKVLQAGEAERTRKEADERKAKADAARKAAAANVEVAGSTNVVPANSGSIRADLEAAWAEHGGRV
jgi:hypothetical protein